MKVKDENQLSPFQADDKKHRKTNKQHNRNSLSHPASLHNNLSNSETRNGDVIPNTTNPIADKVSSRRNKYEMTIKDFIMGLITQIPIIGGIVVYHKLVEIDKKIEEMKKWRAYKK
jgi:hypothetical protein